MHPVNFEGAKEIKKPENMTDEQCTSIWAKYGMSTLQHIAALPGGWATIPPEVYVDIDAEGFAYFLTAWKPNYEELQALNRGQAIFIKTIATGLPPMAVFTLDENGEGY